MTMKTQTDLTAQAEVIRTETANKANTANRVGQMLKDIIDGKPISWGGPYTFPDGNTLPTSLRDGTLYVARNEYVNGDNIIPERSWFISNQDNATLFSHYDIIF